MSDVFRIHGDNIIECERIASLIITEAQPARINISLLSPSTILYSFDFEYCGSLFSWDLELLPGFNKAGRHRWEGNIFNALKDNGSFLDETPDAIVSYVEGNSETILYAVEFCSALQAGNQAWQRSGRAFSTGRTGCPYLYIVDFVKYELDPRTRERKALRFPNPVVPYSYISFSKETGNFVAQVYIRAEEFDKSQDRLLRNFDEDDFADKELSTYIVKHMCGFKTNEEEEVILRKNLNVVLFLSQSSKAATNFTTAQWKALYKSSQDIVDFSLKNSCFHFHKTITAKGHHGHSADFLELVGDCSVGLASRDIPFGIIPASKRRRFADGIRHLYPAYDTNVINDIASDRSDLILCMMKGFKPRGDDNRPDRGILPLATMLSSTDVEIMTYIYGPVLSDNLKKLLHNPKNLADSNGFWKSVLSLSNYVALDVPILSGGYSDAEVLLNTTELKEYYTQFSHDRDGLTQPVFSSIPQGYHEDDVDTGIHFLFAHLIRDNCFEGMCNPPGGDWSGLSVLYNGYEVRWLSLPRVSGEVDGKRPDHVLELFGVFRKPLLLAIESKERSSDLEYDVGTGLVNYIQNLMNYIPNVKRSRQSSDTCWQKATDYVQYEDFEVVSAAAYLNKAAQPNSAVFRNSNCDILFIMEPIRRGWNIEIVPNTPNETILKAFLIQQIEAGGFDGITLH